MEHNNVSITSDSAMTVSLTVLMFFASAVLNFLHEADLILSVVARFVSIAAGLGSILIFLKSFFGINLFENVKSKQDKNKSNENN